MKYEREGNLIKAEFGEDWEPDDPLCIIAHEWYPEWLIQLKFLQARFQRWYQKKLGITPKIRPWKKWPEK